MNRRRDELAPPGLGAGAGPVNGDGAGVAACRGAILDEQVYEEGLVCAVRNGGGESVALLLVVRVGLRDQCVGPAPKRPGARTRQQAHRAETETQAAAPGETNINDGQF